MRYRIGEEVQDLDVENLGEPVIDGLLIFSVILGLLMGIIFIVAGKKGKQIWLMFWGTGLVIVSLLYLAADLMGYIN